MKCPDSPRSKKVRQVKTEVKSMLIIFLGIKSIVHKEIVLVGQTVSSADYCDVRNCKATYLQLKAGFKNMENKS
jgi:hypothetical protein